jgi:protein transport protein SEC31
MSDIAWHPDNATRLVTCSEDDLSPVVMVWDLRNARAPEKLLTGHEKGVLSLAWCAQDADLLLSCGKDNRALCWNPGTAEVVGELPAADNWAFQVDWCPRNPDLFAVALFDGTIGVHNAQSTKEQDDPGAPAAASLANGADIFDNPVYARSNQATLALRQPPKWLRRPVSASFGFGGQLVSTANLPSAQGKNQSAVVHLRKVVTESNIIDRAVALQKAIDADTLVVLAQERSQAADGKANVGAGWKALLSLFQSNSRDELVTLLGFSKSEIAARVAEAVANLKATARPKSPIEEDLADAKPFEPSVVSFAEPEPEPEPPVSEATPSEVSATTDASGTQHADGESTTTAPSLFGDDAPATPQTDAASDFFSSMGIARGGADQMDVPHTDYPADSSVAATIASRPSSAMSEHKAATFRIYPQDESETDRLVTKALVLGDFESAVSLSSCG